MSRPLDESIARPVGELLWGIGTELSPPEPNPQTGEVAPEKLIPYLAQRCDRGRLAILVGAGASASAGLPLWSEIGRRLQQELKKENPGLDDTAALASLYVDRIHQRVNDRRAAKKQLIDLIQHQLYAPKAEPRAPFGEVYPLLARLPVANYYTTNWDQLLVQCLCQTGLVESFDNETIVYSPAPASGDRRHVVFLHGTIPGQLDQVIVTLDDYRTFERAAHNVFERLLVQFKADTTLLCLGYSFGDLNVLTYLQRAMEGGDPGCRIYALLPRPSAANAFNLWRQHGITPVPLAAQGAAMEAWVCAFLDALLGSLGGQQQPFSPPAAEAVPVADDQEQVAQLLRRVEARAERQGLFSPAEWFVAWPAAAELKPEPPPTHYLLDRVFVDRNIKAGVVEAVKAGGKAGISGLVGIGGVGKSFLAMKICQELVSLEGWDVVWVGLLNQGTTEALDLLAAAYRLRFLEGLHSEQKVLGLRFLFSEVALGPRRTLVVLDNAERFPNLPLLLEAVSSVPVLLTSRTEECRDIIRYHRIDSMSDEEAAELCRLYLNTYDGGRHDRLGDVDREDLRELCRFLGGHPLGIRLVLSGFVQRRALDRLVERPFARIREEIQARGLAAIPAGRELEKGRAGESLHGTIYSTFEWLFTDLPGMYPEAGDDARLLLPYVAALGVEQVHLATISSALPRAVSLHRMQGFLTARPLSQPGSPAPGAAEPEAPERGPLAGVLDPSPPAELVPQAPIASPPPPGEAPEPPRWLTRLELLGGDPKALGAALDALVAVSLVEVDEASKAFRIHPLVREFSFEERAKAVPGEPGERDGGVSGPSLEMIFRCALAVLSPSPESSTSLLDLLPRLRGKPELAKQACSRIVEGIFHVQDKLGEWELARQLLEGALGLARDEQLSVPEGRILCKLGELLDRMELAEGMEMIRAGVEILAQEPFPWSAASYSWSRAYLNGDSLEDEPEAASRRTSLLLRELCASDVALWNHAAIATLGGHLRSRCGEGPEAWQLGLCSSEGFLTNSTIDLKRWLTLECLHRHAEDAIQKAEELYSLACRRSESEARDFVYVSPERHIHIQLELAIQRDWLSPAPEPELRETVDSILALACRAGIRGTAIRLELGAHLWCRAVRERDWRRALKIAEENLALAAKSLQRDRDDECLSWEIRALAARALVGSGDSATLAAVEQGLREAEIRAQRWGRNDLLGWLLLVRALVNSSSQRPNPHAATKALVQARKAFQRQQGLVPVEAAVLASQAVRELDRAEPVFENLRDALPRQDQAPPDYRPWLPSRRGELPERVVCKKDGKTMRLVRAGLQTGPHGGETWMYPFYIDEAPVSTTELSTFLAEPVGDHQGSEERQAAAVLSFATAAAYSRWAGKALPNAFEWYAAKWQLAAGHAPETWRDWPTARLRMLTRIEHSIQGHSWTEQPILTGQRRPISDGSPGRPSAAELEELASGRWLRANPQTWQALSRKVPELAAMEEEPSPAFLRLAGNEVFSSRSLEERLAAIRRLAMSSPEEMAAACAALDGEDGERGRALTFQEQAQFVGWLLHGPPAASVERVEHLMAGGWLREAGTLREAFEHRVVAPLSANAVGFTAPQARELAVKLAGSISLTLEEKKRILAAVPKLSLSQLQELLKILQEEQRKFFALEQKHLPQLVALCARHNAGIVDWLLADEPGFAALAGDPVAAWSSMHARAESPHYVLLENPFEDRAWSDLVVAPVASVDRWRIGLRCVLPIVTASDLDAVEPL